MRYCLGIDLGTTFTSAAVGRDDGRVDLINLGGRTASIPSVVFVRDDGVFVVGEQAEARAQGDPTRVAREFKRRLGDPTPLFLGGSPVSAQALTTCLVREVYAEVVRRMDYQDPDAVLIAHPASYDAYRREILLTAVTEAGVSAASLVIEPVAAACHYMETSSVEAGQIIAVYDFGGGTFDVALLKLTEDGFDLLGPPAGVDNLGGTDSDLALLEYVDDQLDGLLRNLEDDDAGRLTLIRLRRDCREAKERLSFDDEARVQVLFPVHRQISFTRDQLTRIIYPRIGDTLAALRRALDQSALVMADVDRIVLVGGSSYIPEIRRKVAVDTGRPVVQDVDPEHAVALGAARLALTGLEPPRAAAGSEQLTVLGEMVETPKRSAANAGEGLASNTHEDEVSHPERPFVFLGGGSRRSNGILPPSRATAKEKRRRRWVGTATALAIALLGLTLVLVLGTPQKAVSGTATNWSVVQSVAPATTILEPTSTASTPLQSTTSLEVTTTTTSTIGPPVTLLGEEFRITDPDVNSVGITADGSVAISGSADGALRTWDLATGARVGPFPVREFAWDVRVAMDSTGSRAVSTGSPSGDLLWPLHVWEVRSGTITSTLEGHRGEIFSVAISADGSRALSGGRDEAVKLWNLDSGTLVATLSGHSDFVMSTAISADGATGLSGDAGGAVKLWDLNSLSLIATLDGHTDSVNGVAISADGTRGISGSSDGTIRVWDLVNSAEITVLGGSGGRVNAAALSADGTRGVSGAGAVTVWDLATSDSAVLPISGAPAVNGVALTADGQRVVSATADLTVRVWDLA